MTNRSRPRRATRSVLFAICLVVCSILLSSVAIAGAASSRHICRNGDKAHTRHCKAAHYARHKRDKRKPQAGTGSSSPAGSGSSPTPVSFPTPVSSQRPRPPRPNRSKSLTPGQPQPSAPPDRNSPGMRSAA